MSRLGIFAAVALIGAVSSVRADQQVWKIENWPADIDLIPCSAWSKTSNGTWVLDGAVKLGAETMSDIGVKGDAAAHKLDRTCGTTTDNKTDDKATKTNKTKKTKKKATSAN